MPHIAILSRIFSFQRLRTSPIAEDDLAFLKELELGELRRTTRETLVSY